MTDIQFTHLWAIFENANHIWSQMEVCKIKEDWKTWKILREQHKSLRDEYVAMREKYSQTSDYIH